MRPTAPRIYVETSVLNGPFSIDPSVREASIKFFDLVKAGSYSAHVSRYVILEIGRTKDPKVLLQLFRYLRLCRRDAPHGKRVEGLAKAYVDEGAIPTRFYMDALHIASATLGHYYAMVTWNREHLKNLRTLLIVERVNRRRNLRTPLVVTPEEFP